MAEIRLDELDRGILRILQENGRTSYSEMARRLRVPESTVRLRVKKLQEIGVIRKFSALINPFKAGYSIVAFIAVDVEASRIKMAAEELSKLPEVDVLGIATGAHDILMQVTVRDLQELENFLIEKLGRIGGIRSTETSILMSVRKWGYARVF